MTERRYSEDEVSTIFERAAEAQQAVRRMLPPGGEGMSLAELRTIGHEVGIPAELVDQAARSLDQPGTPSATRKFLGLPLGVGRTVELGRRLTDDEWDRLVVDLRETFDARGTVRQDGSLKQWTNGNLQVLLEPSATGHRLRMKTLMGSARASMTMGLFALGTSGALVLAAATKGNFAEGLATMGALMIAGAAMFTIGAARLPGWAKTRLKQMEGIAARLALASGPPDKDALPPANHR